MNRVPNADPSSPRLPDALARQVLARASELDAAIDRSATLAELRAAAAEAGISEQAFDAAVAELDSHPPDVSRPIVARRRWRLILVGAVLSVIAAGGLAYARARATPALTTMERGLGCLSAGDAEELLRPIVSSTGTLAFRQGLQGAGTVLRVEGTPEQLRQVNSALDRHQASGAGACSSGTPSLPVP